MKNIKAIYVLKRSNVFLSGFPALKEVSMPAAIESGDYTSDELIEMAKDANPYPQYYAYDRIEGLM